MPDYELMDAQFMKIFHLDPNDFSLPRYWAMLSGAGHLNKMASMDKHEFHRANVERMQQLRID